MGILSIIWRNFSRSARTRRPTDMPPIPSPFRGLIEQDPDLCTGCKACETVCAPKAISFNQEQETGITWNFFAGQCSFCGLCVQYCPTHAITNQGKLPPITGDQSRLKVVHEILYQACAGCGRPMIPIPEAALERVYGTRLTAAEAEQRSLCQACRQKAASRLFRNAFLQKEA